MAVPSAGQIGARRGDPRRPLRQLPAAARALRGRRGLRGAPPDGRGTTSSPPSMQPGLHPRHAGPRLELPRELNRLPLTSIQFNLERLTDKLDFAGLDAQFDAEPEGASSTSTCSSTSSRPNDGLRIDCDYSTDLFDAATIDRWIGHLRTILAAVAADPACRIEALPILSGDEVRWLVEDLNRSARCRAGRGHGRRPRHRPGRADAGRDRDRLRQRELDLPSSSRQRATAIARCVRAQAGPTPSPRRPSPSSVRPTWSSAMLGIMKAGHAYVPLDPAHPLARSRQSSPTPSAALLLCDGPTTAAIARGRPDRSCGSIGRCPRPPRRPRPCGDDARSGRLRDLHLGLDRHAQGRRGRSRARWSTSCAPWRSSPASARTIRCSP